MSVKRNLYLCMGSACHQQGVYGVLPRVQQLLEENGLTDSIELKGAFCLGPCTHGVVLAFEDHVFLNVRPSNVDRKFHDEILPCLTSTQERNVEVEATGHA